MECYDSECCKSSAEDITNMLKVEFDCRPGAIATSLALREPNYQETAAYSHFGRKQYTKDGIKFFEWENEKKLTKYTTMDPAQVTFEIDSNGILNLGAEDKGTGNAEKITESTAQTNDGGRPERRGSKQLQPMTDEDHVRRSVRFEIGSLRVGRHPRGGEPLLQSYRSEW